MTKSKIPMLLSILVFAATAFYGGYRRGFSKGQISMKNELYPIYAEEVSYYKKMGEARWLDGASYGQGIAERTCEDRLSIEKSIQTEDLKKAYKLGQVDGMKRIGKLCGIKIK